MKWMFVGILAFFLLFSLLAYIGAAFYDPTTGE
jgi:hypothetical protein